MASAGRSAPAGPGPGPGSPSYGNLRSPPPDLASHIQAPENVPSSFCSSSVPVFHQGCSSSAQTSDHDISRGRSPSSRRAPCSLGPYTGHMPTESDIYPQLCRRRVWQINRAAWVLPVILPLPHRTEPRSLVNVLLCTADRATLAFFIKLPRTECVVEGPSQRMLSLLIIFSRLLAVAFETAQRRHHHLANAMRRMSSIAC
ncbi:hypothetical protein BD414DRAFT_62665 [Trametes punicea]|nr:hypothetical protein BD414DRAFT_62665 [Trametes punicea]